MSGNDRLGITVGVDGSAESRIALEWALAEGRLGHGQVRAVTAWEYPPVTVGMEGLIWDPELFGQAAQSIQTDVLKRVDTDGVPISGDVIQGQAARVLLNAAKDADFLVAGARGLGGFTGLLLGSVSTQVVRYASCAVLVVRERPGPAGNSGRNSGCAGDAARRLDLILRAEAGGGGRAVTERLFRQCRR